MIPALLKSRVPSQAYKIPVKGIELSDINLTHVLIFRAVFEGSLTLLLVSPLETGFQSPRMLSQDDASGIACRYYCQR